MKYLSILLSFTLMSQCPAEEKPPELELLVLKEQFLHGILSKDLVTELDSYNHLLKNADSSYVLHAILSTKNSFIIISKHKSLNKILITKSKDAEYQSTNLTPTNDEEFVKRKLENNRDIILPVGKVYLTKDNPYTILLNSKSGSSKYTSQTNRDNKSQ